VEDELSRWTSLLHLLQMALMALVMLGSVLLLFVGFRFVLEPLGLLEQAIGRIDAGDFGARVERSSSDEFGTLADGFNGMAEHLQRMHRNLEAKVSEKTAELQEKRERLQALYDVTSMVNGAASLDELAQGFASRVRSIARADGVALRWADEAQARFLMLACEGLPDWMSEGEHCIQAGDCHCGVPSAKPGLRTVPILPLQRIEPLGCQAAGFNTLVSLPVRHKDRQMGEVDLFFHAQVTLSAAERSLLEALVVQLATAMENLRLDGLEKEAAIAEERGFLARELHDSIAQSLAFLKIQVQLMDDALKSADPQQQQQVLGEIDAGVRECHGDVRELLMHFRTRANAEDIAPALQTTLRKFEHQTGLAVTLAMQGHGVPLAPDLQIQVLHIVQEALSNVRKHSRAARVWLDVQQQPAWRFEVRDDGIGFDCDGPTPDETHVGLRIMRERAQRIGAALDVMSTPGRGSSVVLTLPAVQRAAAPPLAARAAA
ncbi:MAG: histidine kinase, partial [Alphaproteobacteria bacterium]|nr:histidine kinase [Alphaproteobacteria bacterium]